MIPFGTPYSGSPHDAAPLQNPPVFAQVTEREIEQMRIFGLGEDQMAMVIYEGLKSRLPAGYRIARGPWGKRGVFDGIFVEAWHEQDLAA